MRSISSIVFFRFIIIFLAQIIVFNNILIFGLSADIYIIFLLIFPQNINKSLYYFLIFLYGIFLDSFSNSFGIITFSLLISAYLRPYILDFSFGNFDMRKVGKVRDYLINTTIYQKLTYISLVIFSHNFVLYFIEIFSIYKLDLIFRNATISSLISITLILIILSLFYYKMRDKLLQLLIISVGILVIVKLFSLQVINSSSELIYNNASVQKIYEFPERGYIYDRNNKLIVSNDFSYDILVVPADVNLEDSILISKDFNIDTSVFNEKLLDAKNFSNVKASILINNISKDEYAPIQGKTLETQWFFRSKNLKELIML